MLKIDNLNITGKKITLIDNNGESIEIKTTGNITITDDLLQIDLSGEGKFLSAQVTDVAELIVDVHLDDSATPADVDTP